MAIDGHHGISCLYDGVGTCQRFPIVFDGYRWHTGVPGKSILYSPYYSTHSAIEKCNFYTQTGKQCRYPSINRRLQTPSNPT